MILTKELVEQYFGVVNRGSVTDARAWLLEVVGYTRKEAVKSASDLAAYSKALDATMPVERRKSAKDLRVDSRIERRVGAKDTRPLPQENRRVSAVDTRPLVVSTVPIVERRKGAPDTRQLVTPVAVATGATATAAVKPPAAPPAPDAPKV